MPGEVVAVAPVAMAGEDEVQVEYGPLHHPLVREQLKFSAKVKELRKIVKQANIAIKALDGNIRKARAKVNALSYCKKRGKIDVPAQHSFEQSGLDSDTTRARLLVRALARFSLCPFARQG